MNIGYVRVSTEEQNPARQEALMKELGVEKIYIDVCSGATTNRPELQKLLAYGIRPGDTVIVESISRFSRNLQDMLSLIEQLAEKRVGFRSQKEPFIDTTSPQGELLLSIFSALAEFERKNILQRQREGIEIAKAQGKYTGRKPKNPDNWPGVYKLWVDGDITCTKACKLLEISRSTFYRMRDKEKAKERSSASTEQMDDEVE